MSSPSAWASSAFSALLLSSMCDGFSINSARRNLPRKHCRLVPQLHVYAPPGSGYLGRDPQNPDPNDPYALTKEQIDQILPPAYPETYEPMLEYPGTMRPGRTPENMPYHDLPGLGLDDPDPVPWPHFQEIEWHHQWDPPHEQAPLMEDFIEMHGRWATVEEEAEMRMGMRRGVRERREMEESGAGDNAMVIMDDDEEDDGALDVPSMMGLGDGVEAFIGGKKTDKKTTRSKQLPEEDEDVDDESDDFLFDLGLGDEDDEEEEIVKPKSKKSSKSKISASAEEESDDAALDDDDLDFELGFDLDDEDMDLDMDDADDGEEDDDYEDFDDDEEDVSIDDLNAKDDGDDEDDFDDGGFDYDD